MTNYKLELKKSTHILCADGEKWAVFTYPVDPSQELTVDWTEVSDIGSYLNTLSKQVYAASDHEAIGYAKQALGLI